MGSFVEEKKDLFTVDQNYALAHCVGNDFIMGAGIAVEFKKRFGHQTWLRVSSKGIGTTLLLPSSVVNRNVFYLITKPYSKSSKPSYEDMEKSIIDMFLQASEKGISKIAMPKLGCGLDGKKWSTVKQIIQKHQGNIDVLVCYI